MYFALIFLFAVFLVYFFRVLWAFFGVVVVGFSFCSHDAMQPETALTKMGI